MMNLSDLLKWLRFQDKTYGAEELGQAANEIERLQRENERLRKDLGARGLRAARAAGGLM